MFQIQSNAPVCANIKQQWFVLLCRTSTQNVSFWCLNEILFAVLQLVTLARTSRMWYGCVHEVR